MDADAEAVEQILCNACGFDEVTARCIRTRAKFHGYMMQLLEMGASDETVVAELRRLDEAAAD